MNPKLKYERRFKYPHLLPSDATLWDKFITTYPEFFDEIEYDVHVGEGIEIDQNWPDYIATMATILTQRRIDVVGYKNSQVWIVELKHDPGVGALGQLIAYQSLYLREHTAIERVELALISNRIDRDLAFLLTKHNIHAYVV